MEDRKYEPLNTREKMSETAKISFKAYNINTKKHETFSQVFFEGMQIEHLTYYGHCKINKIDNTNERIYYSSQKNDSGNNSWAFSTVSGLLANGKIIVPSANYNSEFSNKAAIASNAVDSETKDIRKKWEASNLCDDGHYVRSYSEMLIDNWLYYNGYLHAYEKKVFMRTEPDEIVLCDFYLPKGNVYIEFWGKDTEEYNMRRERKMKLYEENNYRVISIESDDIKVLSDILQRKIFDYIKEN